MSGLTLYSDTSQHPITRKLNHCPIPMLHVLLNHFLRRWPNILSTSVERLVFAEVIAMNLSLVEQRHLLKKI